MGRGRGEGQRVGQAAYEGVLRYALLPADMVLNHKQTGTGAKHYDMYAFDREKKAALGLWERKVETLVGLRDRPALHQVQVEVPQPKENLAAGTFLARLFHHSSFVGTSGPIVGYYVDSSPL